MKEHPPHNWKPRRRECCGTVDRTLVSDLRCMPRGRRPRAITSRKVWHRRGESRWWHWEDTEELRPVR